MNKDIYISEDAFYKILDYGIKTIFFLGLAGFLLDESLKNYNLKKIENEKNKSRLNKEI